MQMKKTVLFLISVLFFGALRAQESPHTDTLGVKVYFRQGYSLLEPSYRDNGVRLAAFAAHVESLQRDTLVRVKSIRVTGTASPDGTSRSNERLSENRAKNIIAWFEERFSFPGVSFDAHAEGIDWAGLTALVETSEMPYRDEVLNILYNTPEWIIRDGRVVDGRKRQLGLLRGGRAWWYMAEHFFPQLWSGGMHLSCEIERRIVPQPEPEPASEPQPEPEVAEELGCESVHIPDPVVGQTPAPEPAAEIAAQPVVPEGKPFYMSLKTNLLYDAALVPNLGAEFYVGRGWSLGGSWMYAWWKNDRRHNYWRIYGGELDVRRYFGRRAAEKPLTGHHVGLYGQMLTYDFERGGKGCLGGKPGGTLWDKMSWGVGLEYGYALPIGRRLNLDFGIGVGYLGGEYWEYKPVDNHYVWQATKHRHWFGPTKAEVSLVWLIGSGNFNRKGGKR